MKKRILGTLCGMLCALFLLPTSTANAQEYSTTITPTAVKDIKNDATNLLVEYPATGDLNYRYIFQFTLKSASDVRITGLSRYTLWSGGETKYTLTNSLDEFNSTISKTWTTDANAANSWSDKAGNYCDNTFSLKKGTYYLTVETSLLDITRSWSSKKVTDYPNGFWLSINTSDYIKKTTLKMVKNTGKNTAKVGYTRSDKAEGYQIQYSANKNFKNKKSVTTINTYATLRSLKKGTTYYVRIRPYRSIDGQKVFGNWSNTKTVKVK